jgi:exopolysaccharide biosynthesis protein
MREFLAETVISTQHRDWAWIFVGAEQRDYMVRKLQESYDLAAAEKQNFNLIHHNRRPIDSLIKVEDISGKLWKGKKMYVYDPTTIRVMTPAKPGEGEKITSMVKRTGAVAGVNGGGFVDPDGLGNGFAAIGPIISGGEVIYTDQDGSVPQHIVGFTKEGTLVIGKYDIFELRKLGVTEAVSFYPRVIANGKPLITSGDGGWGRGPRTAVGQKADGTVIFVVIDGRQAHSVGATLKEVQDLLLEEGCVNAGFLDGGASSEMVVNGELITKPSSRYGERRLPSAFLVFDQPENVKANRVWDNIDKIDPGGAYDHPDYLREQAELKAKQAKNPPSSTSAPKQEPAKSEPQKTSGTGAKQNETNSGKDTEKPGGLAVPNSNESTKPTVPGGQSETGKNGASAPGEPPPVKPANGGTLNDSKAEGAPANGAGGAAAPTGQPSSDRNGTGGSTAAPPAHSPPTGTNAPATGGTSSTTAPNAPSSGGGATTPTSGTQPSTGGVNNKQAPTSAPSPASVPAEPQPNRQ